MFRAAVIGTTIKPGKVPPAPMANLFPANVIGCHDPGIALGNREVVAELTAWLFVVFVTKPTHDFSYRLHALHMPSLSAKRFNWPAFLGRLPLSNSTRRSFRAAGHESRSGERNV